MGLDRGNHFIDRLGCSPYLMFTGYLQELISVE